MMTHLGEFTLRDGSQYLHVKTDITSDNIMMFFSAWGYLYNSAGLIGWGMGYSYDSTSILNTYLYNVGSTSFHGLYRAASPYNVCLRFNRGGTGYTEGKINIFFAAFGLGIRPAVVAFSQNNTSGNYY
jgi:hypothetical protein